MQIENMPYAYKDVRESLFRQAYFWYLPTSEVLNLPILCSLNARSFRGEAVNFMISGFYRMLDFILAYCYKKHTGNFL